MKFDWKQATQAEREAAVARHVMGICTHDFALQIHFDPRFYQCRKCGLTASTQDEKERVGTAYTTDYNKTVLVIEKMRERGFSFGCRTVMPCSSVMAGWSVVFCDSIFPPWDCNNDSENWFSANEGTFSEAVCVAALRACCVDVYS